MMPNVFHVLVALSGLGIFVMGVFMTLLVLRIIHRRRRSRRTVEAPNSHYTSHLARETAARHRWHGMALDGVHEINREEVVRLLAKADMGSAQSLNGKEREFLDYMAELAGRPA